MTHCDFSVRYVRHIIGCSESDVVTLGLFKIRTGSAEGSCVKRKRRGRNFVHELTSEVNSRISAWRRSWPCQERERKWRICPCLGSPRAMKEDQDLSTQVYGRSPTRDKLECGCTVNAKARIDTHDTRENGINRNMAERGSAGVDDAGTEESKDFNEDVQDCLR